ncbi:SMC family ATPase [Jeotgalibacillus haloalkalitolerans]|uniref:Nuclease SbcCD subunit C n=1 Tax=Jeotgalibacillus haloalkalitolerans TaxID=3104292 RepID=A0ABU5KKP1_9BACL|nr:SMC family ATPase [Jeotgalibacillus sp. HH7-29]MDZ5711832.1 SMC family ATPase [Jeotgalibacillus sp. HH7-29]
MRPKKLIIRAFGPYANTEEINFEELGSRTMFVISGKTGAGKTTIFDAIAFALYGKTSGEERSAQDLRSDFAEQNMLTSVDFTFSLKNRTYRIVRSPIQSRRKARGEGFTTVSAKAEIYEVTDGEEKLLGSTLSESDDQINRLMQLDFHQFKQILMIPQGEFRTLLTSDSTDKERILQKLFHTESYRYFQEYLKSKSKELREEAAGFLKDRTRFYDLLNPLDHLELTDALNQEVKHDKLILTLVNNLVATQKEKFESQKHIIQNKKEQYKDILKKIENALYIERAFKELQKTHEDLAQLKERQKEIAGWKDRLRIAREADQIWPFYKEVLTKEKESEQRTRFKEETHAQLSVIQQEYNQLKQKMEHLNQQKEEIASDEKKLNDLYLLKQKLERYLFKTEELTRHAQSGKADKEKLDKLKEQLAEYEKLKTDLSVKQQKWYEQQAKSADLKVEISELTSFLKICRELEEIKSARNHLENDLKVKNDNLLKINRELIKEQTELDKAQNEQFIQHAFELSGQLKQGEACPVCGSTHHPSPAVREGETIDTEVIQQNIQSFHSEKIRNESAIEHAENRMNQIDLELKKLNGEKESSKYFNERYSMNHYIEMKGAYEQEQHVLSIQLKDGEPSAEIKTAEQKILKLHQDIQQLEALVQKKRDDYISIRSQVNQLKEEIPEKYLNKEFLSSEISALEKNIQHFKMQYEQSEAKFLHADKEFNRLSERLKQAENEVLNTEKSLKEASDHLQDALEKSLFDQMGELVEGKLSDTEREELDQSVSSYEKKLFSLNEYAEKLKIDLEDVSKPDMKLLESEKTAVETELTKLEEEHSWLSAYIQQHEQILKNLDENLAASAETEKRYLLTGQLSEIANGQNELKLTFERFVLAYYLEDILIVANERLLKMTSGRYELHRKEDRSKGNKQGGLELLVMDHYTGQQRHVKTLSGGEAFKASLALALGLADVVQSYAGGVSLETMFIDEGFGTLDPESLDQAIESLMDIQSGGRLVGVISHVPELKERIDARLEVFSTKGGSSTKFIFETL